MTAAARPSRILIVTGLSGAGKFTALKTLEDLGWEVVDNLPLLLLDRLLAAPMPPGASSGDRPLAIGVDSRTRGFDAGRIVHAMERLRGDGDSAGAPAIEMLFLDCANAEIVRRYSETRRRHPLAADRAIEEGIEEERAMMAPLRLIADQLVDTTDTSPNALQAELRARYGASSDGLTISLLSFGFARGLPRNADLVFDMRFLRNPHWEPALRPHSGQEPAVAAYIAQDPAYEEAMTRLEDMLALLLPRYAQEGKSYVTIAIGCTGGKHRSVHVAERLARELRRRGFSPTLAHRDLAARMEKQAETERDAAGKGPHSGV